MLRYLSLDIICSTKLTVFLELRSRKTVHFSKQIMSADKCPGIFSSRMEAIVYISPNFQNCARCVKDLKDNKHGSLHLGRKYARIFVLGHYLFLEAHSFPRATLSRFSEQIMSADKYPSIFSRQMAAIVYIFPNFQNCARCEKYLKDDKHNSLHLGRKYAQIFVHGSSKLTVTLSENCSLLGTDNVCRQISIPSVFSRQMEAIVYIERWQFRFFVFVLSILIHTYITFISPRIYKSS